MRQLPDAAQCRDTRIENFVADLTGAVYPVVLRRQPKGSWLKVELGLWKALAETVHKWAPQRPAVPAEELPAWRDAFLLELTESAFHVALVNGIKGSLLEVELCLYRVIRLVMRRHTHVREPQ
jgi:hypothetical protein